MGINIKQIFVSGPKGYEKDLKMIERMLKEGGSFVQCLGDAMLCADPINYRKLIDAFPEYVKDYTEKP